MAGEYGGSPHERCLSRATAHGHLAEGVRASGRPGRHRRARVGPDARPGRAQAHRVRLRARAAPGLPRRVGASSGPTSCRTSGASTSRCSRRSTCPTSTTSTSRRCRSPTRWRSAPSKPIIVLNSGLVNLLDEDELRTVLAHEVAHILSDHVLYRTALEILLRLTVGAAAAARRPAADGRAHGAARVVRARPSCRATAPPRSSPATRCRSAARSCSLTAGVKPTLDLDAYLVQAAEYHEGGKGLDKLQRLWMELGVTHALPVKRVHEVMEWVRGGDFDRIVGGEYPQARRPGRRPRAGRRGRHLLRERFASAFKDAGENLATASDAAGRLAARGGQERRGRRRGRPARRQDPPAE